MLSLLLAEHFPKYCKLSDLIRPGVIHCQLRRYANAAWMLHHLLNVDGLKPRCHAILIADASCQNKTWDALMAVSRIVFCAFPERPIKGCRMPCRHYRCHRWMDDRGCWSSIWERLQPQRKSALDAQINEELTIPTTLQHKANSRP